MDHPLTSRPRVRRRKYLIDKAAQLRLIGQLVLGLVVLTVTTVVGLYIAFGADGTHWMHPTLRDALLKSLLSFFVVVSIMIVILGIILTHQFVGPAYVMRLAVEGMLVGDYSRRLTLRKGDYFQELAGKLVALRDQCIAREREIATAVAAAERCVASHDLAGAHAALRALQHVTRRSAETAPAADTPSPESALDSSPRQPIGA